MNSDNFFINKKLTKRGLICQWYIREMKAKLSSEIIVNKSWAASHINVTDNDDMEQWDAVIMETMNY